MRILPMLCAVLALAVAPGATALTYGYSGNSYTLVVDNTPPSGTYTTSMNVSGSFTIAGSLAPNLALTDISGSVLSYSFNDGINTHTQANSSFVGPFNVATDGTGQIAEWQFTTSDTAPLGPGGSLGDQRQVILSNAVLGFVLDRGILQECSTVTGCSISTDVGQTANNAGSWSFVPEPSTALLLAAGLVPMAWRWRRS